MQQAASYTGYNTTKAKKNNLTDLPSKSKDLYNQT